jgi:hypothetical protein
MKATSILFLFLIASNAFASCPEMAKKAVSKYKKENSVTPSSYSLFANVMKHYRTEIAQDSEFKPYIERNTVYIKGNKVSGFGVSVTMGGDEDSVRYILNEKKQIVVAYWSNQSPMTYWFCGKKTADEAEETIEGSEIGHN